uniref:CACTA en-spm transposon protein n=1 Tax=Cucumis melo TaxID=3656 RepID=A0A9I9EIN0_CUCME
MSIGNSLFLDAFLGIFRCRATASRNPLYNRFSFVKYRTKIERGKERRSKCFRRRRSATVCHFSQAIGVCVEKTFSVCCLKWVDVGREYIEVVKGDLQRLFVLDLNDQAMNRFVEHQMLTTFKEFRTDCHTHFKKYSDLEEARANPPNALVRRHEDCHFLCDHYISRAFQVFVMINYDKKNNHGRTRLLDRSNLTIIVTGPSRFYNDSTSSLREKGSWSIVWSCSEKHTFELGRFCRRPSRMRIIKCWNSNPSLSQRVVSHSLRMRYAIRCWVGDQATQKALVGDPSRRPAERRVQAVHRHLVRSPQKKRLKYKLNFMKLWNGLKYKI